MKMKKEGDVDMDYIKAFIVGGIICAITQVLMEKTKLMPGRIMVILVTSGIVLGACGIYEPKICRLWCQCSAYRVWQCFMEGYENVS